MYFYRTQCPRIDLNLDQIQGVLALCEFHYCEFHYCDFSKLSINIWLMRLLAILFCYCRAVARWGLRGAIAPPIFGRLANPISTRGDTLSPPSTTSPPKISDLATALYSVGVHHCDPQLGSCYAISSMTSHKKLRLAELRGQ